MPMSSPWPSGTNAPKKLKDELAAFIETLRTQFPARRFVAISVGEKKSAAIKVEIYSQADPEPAYKYLQSDGREVLEEYHRVAIDVKADKNNGGAESAEEVYEIIRSALLSGAGSAHLISCGLCDVREIPEAPVYGEAEFERPLHLSCNTDKYLT